MAPNPSSTPVCRKLHNALPPVAAYAALGDAPYGFILDSVVDVGGYGRYSVLGAWPFAVLKVKGREACLLRDGGEQRADGDAFDCLRDLLSERRRPAEAEGPYGCGAVGYLGYDLCHLIEDLPSTVADHLPLPDMYLGFYDAVAVFDHHQRRAWVVAEQSAEQKVQRLVEALQQRGSGLSPRPLWSARSPDVALSGEIASPRQELRCNFSREGYLAAIARAKEYIAAGDIFQVNLSQRFSLAWPGDAFELYLRLRVLNPAPFAAFLRFPELAVASSSPELFLRVRGRQVLTRPIKGTRPRGAAPAVDERLRRALMASEKDRAELLMITDLERNDLGRVCEFGSVHVPELRAVESYATVHHLVATVTGILRPEVDTIDLLRATFPGGSITGAPKVRAMEIIDELEPTARGVYTGAIGHLGFGGSVDLNIAIRTIVVSQGWAHYQVGGGIVADSDPAAEYQETLDKGKALAQALTCR